MSTTPRSRTGSRPGPRRRSRPSSLRMTTLAAVCSISSRVRTTMPTSFVARVERCAVEHELQHRRRDRLRQPTARRWRRWPPTGAETGWKPTPSRYTRGAASRRRAPAESGTSEAMKSPTTVGAQLVGPAAAGGRRRPHRRARHVRIDRAIGGVEAVAIERGDVGRAQGVTSGRSGKLGLCVHGAPT